MVFKCLNASVLFLISLIFIYGINYEEILWADQEISLQESILVVPETSNNNKEIDLVQEIEFVFIKGGKFQMGDTFGDGDRNEKPVREIYVEDFYLGKYEVTQGEWEMVMGYNPSWFKKGRNYPVDNVSWDEIQEFILELNLQTDGKYRLPTEAEWEFAARSRGKMEKWSGTNNNINEYAWCNINSESSTHPVGQKKANGLSLYDMSGNLWEWVDGEYIDFNHPDKTVVESSYYVRGGSWVNDPKHVRCSFRKHCLQSTRSYIYGFRLARFP